MSYRTFTMSCLIACAACSPDRGASYGLGTGDAGPLASDHDASVDAPVRGYAVMSGDYAVTAVSLLKVDGTLKQASFIDSGSTTTGLVTALSGDVVLPTRSGEQGVLPLLDRFRTDVLTRVELVSGKVLGQLKTQASNAQADKSYSSNPHDYIFFDDTTAWLSRYEPNEGAKVGDPDRGADLIRVDPTHFTRTGDRIDFSKWNGQGVRTNPDTHKSETVTVYARPSGMVRVGTSGKLVVVGIDVQSLAFDAIGDGLVALVDLSTKHVTMLKLPGLQSCGNVAPVPNDPMHVAVGCTGFYYGTARDTAGIAIIAVVGNTLQVESVWHAKDDPKSALTMYDVLPIDAHEVLAVAAGDKEVMDHGKITSPETHDKLYRVKLDSGEQDEVFEADGRFVIGGGAYDASTGLLLVPDASTDAQGRPSAGVHRMQRQKNGSFKALGITKLDAILPARTVRAFE